ncbi:MAG: hypothetical protein M1817_003978 [Caeruleum heppii]|nr:MAG: hypothetical protein M1817_003978 [Caeruleum heppii]
MSIPNAREHVPPPLPPPRHIEALQEGGDGRVDLGWRWGNGDDVGFGGKSVSPASSLVGSTAGLGYNGRRPSCARAGSSGATVTSPSRQDTREETIRHPDEGYASLSGSSLSNHKLQGEETQRNAFLQRSVQDYDNSLLQRIDPARRDPSSRRSIGSTYGFQALPFASSESAALPKSKQTFGASKLKPLSMLGGNPAWSSGSSNDSHRPWPSLPDSAVSPRHQPSEYSTHGYMDYRAVKREVGSLSSLPGDLDQSPSSRRGTMERSRSGMLLESSDDRPTDTLEVFPEPESDFPVDETGLRQLHLGERSPPRVSRSSASGQKRRASSPPRDPDGRLSLHPVSSAGDLFQRRVSGHLTAERKSSVPRLNSGSVSSSSSAPRHGSYASSGAFSVAASSRTSMSSYNERVSPSGTSPSSELDASRDSPYVSSMSLNPSPRASLSSIPQRSASETKNVLVARKVSSDGSSPAKLNGVSKLPGLYICECCPKKPKKFENMEDLRNHEMEKQYMCQYCHNRFKNKNEAERHQNSLHLRRHSWSCAAISGVEAAFHPAPHKTARADVCGYCGDEFPLPADWTARVEHLNTIHKFGECNQMKKFFRADHFRQHLKHSHAGTSGKWTNMLENACMKDEPLPIPLSERVGSVSEGVGRIDEEREEP